MLIVGATFERINVRQVKERVVYCPSPLEQDGVADYCWRVRDLSASVVAKLDTQITKFQEYRHTLSSAAVTGKINVAKEAG